MSQQLPSQEISVCHLHQSSTFQCLGKSHQNIYLKIPDCFAWRILYYKKPCDGGGYEKNVISWVHSTCQHWRFRIVFSSIEDDCFTSFFHCQQRMGWWISTDVAHSTITLPTVIRIRCFVIFMDNMPSGYWEDDLKVRHTNEFLFLNELHVG